MAALTKIVNETVAVPSSITDAPYFHHVTLLPEDISKSRNRREITPLLFLSPTLNLFLLDSKPLRLCDIDPLYPVLYAFVWADDTRSVFPEDAKIQVSMGEKPGHVSTLEEPDGHIEWVDRATVSGQSSVGYVTDATLMTEVAERNQIDRVNSIEVAMISGETLESVALSEMLAGKNRMLIGDEIVGFQTVELLATVFELYPNAPVYKLSVFMRGLQDTEIAAAEDVHMVYQLDAPWTAFCIPRGEIGVETTYRVLPDRSWNTIFLPAIYFPVTAVGRSILPMPPAGISAAQNSTTNDWTITWNRVSRAPRQYELSKLGPLDVDPIQAKVEIKATAGGSILRTITVEGADTVTYTSAQQTADFGSAQSSLNFEVYNYTDAGDGTHTVETNVVDVFGA